MIATFNYTPQIRIVYKNLGKSATLAIVITNDVDLQTAGEFFDEVLDYINKHILNKSLYQAPDLETGKLITPEPTNTNNEDTYEPFSAKNAEKSMKSFQAPLEKWLSDWNNDPTKKSKIGQLRT